MSQPGIWADQRKAQTLGREKVAIEKDIEAYETPTKAIQDAIDLIEMAGDEHDPSFEDEITQIVETAATQIANLEFARMMAGEHDRSGAIVTIHAGAGGTESQDWVAMLLRMYLRYCERRSYKIEILDELPGDEAGLKSTTFSVEGDFSYGYLKAETGVHRLVRISPFDANARRHTTFASVAVLPDIEEAIEIEIRDDDLRVDTYRSGGAGGQHVNKTDSAVRLTHLPTGIVVQCQNERSQIKNRSSAMKILKARLYDYEQKKKDAERDKNEASKLAIDFGSQIRSYVLHPYRLVKDVRTGHETGNADAVLDGELHPFIQSYLIQASGTGR